MRLRAGRVVELWPRGFHVKSVALFSAFQARGGFVVQGFYV